MPIGAAGAVALGVGALSAGASIYGANKAADAQKSMTTNTPEVTGAVNSALAQGESIANRTYTPYNAPRVADISANEQAGSALAATGSAPARSMLDTAAGDITGVKDYSAANLQPYIDPYVSSVLTPQLTQENISFEQQRSALENSKAGAFGGDRSALETTGLERTHGQQIAADVGNAYSKAYTNAQTAFFTDQNKKVTAANALASVAGDVSQLNKSDIQNLMATGGLSRALSQSQLDFNYQQFIENRDWSVTNLQPLLNSIAASKGANMTTTTTGPSSNIAGMAIGAAATIAGAYFTGGASVAPSSTPAWANEPPPQSQAIDPSQLQTPFDPNAIAPADYSSDPLLKFDKAMIGVLPSGLPWWRFRYLSSPHQVHEGVMADEARLYFPEAVRADEHGFLRVNYARIH